VEFFCSMQSSVSATRQTLPAASQEGTGVPSGYSFENLSSVICHLSSVFLLANLRNSLPLRWKRSRDTCAPSLQQGITLRRGRGGGWEGQGEGKTRHLTPERETCPARISDGFGRPRMKSRASAEFTCDRFTWRRSSRVRKCIRRCL